MVEAPEISHAKLFELHLRFDLAFALHLAVQIFPRPIQVLSLHLKSGVSPYGDRAVVLRIEPPKASRPIRASIP